MYHTSTLLCLVVLDLKDYSSFPVGEVVVILCYHKEFSPLFVLAW